MAEMHDLEWLERIYREHQQPLFLTAWNLLRCQSLAEDAVHAAFVRLAQLTAAPRDAKLYAFRAVRNAAIDLMRKRDRTQQKHPLVEYEESSPDLLTEDDESLAAVRDALEQLDERSREAVELHLHGGLTFQEIATLCDEPLQTVASRYRRALEKLRQLLEAHHG